VPAKQTQPYPVVMIHGAGQTGNNFTGTPDGRRGWAHDFLRAGYAVYVVDQPARGRSGQSPGFYGDYTRRKGGNLPVEARFTAPETAKLWPQAARHTQWPGTGQKDDPAFDQFYASQVESLADGEETERMNQQAGGSSTAWPSHRNGAFAVRLLRLADRRYPAGWSVILAIQTERPAFLRSTSGDAQLVRKHKTPPRSGA
jgi:hypothetical protein